MTTAGTFFASSLVLLLMGAAIAVPTAGQAQPADDPEFAALQARARVSFKEEVAPFIETYCSKCHGLRRQKGGINFLPVLKNPGDPASVVRWKQAIASVKTHDMPPEDTDLLPSDEERGKFLNGVAQIKYLSAKDPGEFVIRRLNRHEYGNTLRDLFGVDQRLAADLPDEVFGEGYLNTLSPLQMEQFLEVGNTVLDQVFAPEGKSPTALQRKLLGKTPSRKADYRDAARDVARSLARQCYRRPPSEAEVDTLVGVFDLAQRNQLSYPASLRLMLKAVLVSPQFLFITPSAEAERSGAIVSLDDHHLASRLSYFLWATMPDAELSKLADQGKLHEPSVLQAQVKRMLADKRSQALFDGFGAQWLGLGNLAEKTFDPEKFPQMTPVLRAAMVDEARLFFDSVLRENRSVVTFVNGDYTFLNGTLAPLYGLEKKVTGSAMRRVQLADSNRGGILGMPGILAVTSFPNRTSPVKRGVWVLEQVLGEHIPPPPPDVPALDKQDPQSVANLTLRQRTELHRENAACANCHRILDPIGFGLENFDAIGRWRARDDAGGAIDSAGELPGGKVFTTPRELKGILATRSDDVARNLIAKLLAYALCRQLEGYDEIVVDQLLKHVARDGYRMQTVLTEIANSYPFIHRRIQDQLNANANEKKPAN